ncbi:uncharacterized protein LOC131948748 [Physella acuta]|uniref:uncharacterized protein LOC131948748 n=1 Tax=Physella acuta TaxID=109671 RepID=UPI0027DD1D75|nr:uncharacterized protein LOC131948748 [Physella acuta]
MGDHWVYTTWLLVKEACLHHWKRAGLVALAACLLGLVYAYLTLANRTVATTCELVRANSLAIPDTCPWQMVISDLAHRLRLQEMAFKEQVVAREVMAAEVNNQSYSNLEVEKKLANFTMTIKLLANKIDHLNGQLADVASRLYSDECLGFLVLVYITVQIILAVRARLNVRQGLDLSQLTSSSLPKSASSTSINLAQHPVKPNVSFRQDLCVIALNKNTWKQNSALSDSLLRCLADELQLPVKPFHVIESQELLSSCPRAKVYIVVLDLNHVCKNGGSEVKGDERSSNAVLLESLHQFKCFGGQVILVLSNEEESQRLPAQSLYNSSVPLVRSCDVLQELASNGKVLSVWRELSPYQLSHVKKLIRSLLGTKG